MMESAAVGEAAGASMFLAPAPSGLHDLSSDRSYRFELTDPSLELRHVACPQATLLLLRYILAFHLRFDTKAAAW